MIVYAVFALLSFWTVESVGRRKVFLIGTAGQMVSMIITFACLIPGTPGPAKGAAFGLFLYIAFFGPSYLTVPWLYAVRRLSLSLSRSFTDTLRPRSTLSESAPRAPRPPTLSTGSSTSSSSWSRPS